MGSPEILYTYEVLVRVDLHEFAREKIQKKTMTKILGVSVLAFAVLLVSGEEPSEADLSTQERLAQLKKLAEFKRSQDAAKNSPPKLEDGDILITGR